jgi:hypothetical protein
MKTRVNDKIIQTTAENLGIEPQEVAAVIDEFMLQLHRGIVEYVGFNGDYVGENLSHCLPKQSFFHLLRFLDRFSERYQWEPGVAHEYLSRLGSRADWLPFTHQMNGWVKSSRYAGTTNQTGDDK